jgi:UDP-N-acetylmuramoyl-tripeptide--D-alanyl-D-alanine ligase
MNKQAKAIVVAALSWQVHRLRRKARPRLVAVVGGVGKTSTKLAVSEALKQKFKVRTQTGNYNDIVTVPLVFFGRTSPPALTNPLAWLAILVKNELQLLKSYPYDIVVLELGTDGPGQIAQFRRYLDSIDLAIITSIVPEHMEFFKDLDAVAAEEITVTEFSKVVLANADLCDQKYLSAIKNKSLFTYGLRGGDYRLAHGRFAAGGYKFSFSYGNKTLFSGFQSCAALAQLHTVCVAAAVGHRFALPVEAIKIGVSKIKSVSGRLNQLSGINDSLILDDTYNASPAAVRAALDALYALPAPQKIAILGSMNELGTHSKKAHAEIGAYCDPRQVDLVVTIGHQANRYLAAAAEKRGCTAERFVSPVDAGLFVKEKIRPKAIILAKGSQNGVFAEEAVKQILANPKDAKQLVRQTPAWLRKKRMLFAAGL